MSENSNAHGDGRNGDCNSRTTRQNDDIDDVMPSTSRASANPPANVNRPLEKSNNANDSTAPFTMVVQPAQSAEGDDEDGAGQQSGSTVRGFRSYRRGQEQILDDDDDDEEENVSGIIVDLRHRRNRRIPYVESQPTVESNNRNAIRQYIMTDDDLPGYMGAEALPPSSPSSSNVSDSSLNSHSSYGSSLSSTPDVPLGYSIHQDRDPLTYQFINTSAVRSSWNVVQDILQRADGLPRSSKRAKPLPRLSSTNPAQFQARAYGSLHMVQRLSVLHTMVGHRGCVNSLHFNSSGTLLASGSDDKQIYVWNWQTGKLLRSIKSGHQSNIFQTKFLEYEGRQCDIEIVSTSRDGQVRHTRIRPEGSPSNDLLFRQARPIHKVAIPPRTPHELLTADEEGVVKGYDLREGSAIRLVKLPYKLFTIASHPLDREFCVAGTSQYVHVYDRRKTKSPLKIYDVMSSNNVRDTRRNYWKSNRQASITCAVYNHTGTEILASYSDDDIFLFENVKYNSNKILGQYSGHCNRDTIKSVNFFGPHSEYVMSGSDCGNIFLWDKKSQIIVNWMKGDTKGAVNCLETHPGFPIIATSGIEPNVKIWTPNGANHLTEDVPRFTSSALLRCVNKNLFKRRFGQGTHFGDTMMQLLQTYRTEPETLMDRSPLTRERLEYVIGLTGGAITNYYDNFELDDSILFEDSDDDFEVALDDVVESEEEVIDNIYNAESADEFLVIHEEAATVPADDA